MEGRCKNCINYNIQEGFSGFQKGTGMCDLMKSAEDGGDINKEQDNVYCDSADWHCLLIVVGENFGCIHFKDKTKEE